MPFRLIGFILFAAVLLAFIGFNLGNACDVSFGFTVLHSVPIFLTVFAAFALGLLAALPSVFKAHRRAKKRFSRAKGVSGELPPSPRSTSAGTDAGMGDGSYGVD